MKITITKEVRLLLQELDDTMERFHAATRILADRTTSNEIAMYVGADREAIRSQIVGIAWRLNKASTGRKE